MARFVYRDIPPANKVIVEFNRALEKPVRPVLMVSISGRFIEGARGYCQQHALWRAFPAHGLVVLADTAHLAVNGPRKTQEDLTRYLARFRSLLHRRRWCLASYLSPAPISHAQAPHSMTGDEAHQEDLRQQTLLLAALAQRGHTHWVYPGEAGASLLHACIWHPPIAFVRARVLVRPDSLR